MSGTRWLGEWQSKLTHLLAESERCNAVLNIVDIWNLPTAGASSQGREGFLDAMRPLLAEGRLRIISEVNAVQLQDMHRIPKFVSLFEVIRIEPLSDQQIRSIIAYEADKHTTRLDESVQEHIFRLCDTFSSARYGPGPFLNLIDKLLDYRDQKLAVDEDAGVDIKFVDKVFSIHSGLPLFVVSRTENQSADQIRDWFRARIVGQEDAIEAVIEMISLYKARLHEIDKPIGSFLFVGPTGVGKTELARVLAEFFFGSERRMLRFDMSEFADYHSFEMLVGSTRTTSERPARLLDPIRLQPFQVLLFDELEKAHRNIHDIFLQMLDAGRLSSPQGETVNFRNAIIIATSNVGAFEGMTSTIGFGVNPNTFDGEKAFKAIESFFRPEFLNRFQHIVLFRALTHEQAVRIARIDLHAVLKREGISGQNLIVDVHDDVIDHLIKTGFNPRYGGRAIKREIKRQIILPLAMLLMERTLEPGTLIEISLRRARIQIQVADSPDANQTKGEPALPRSPSGQQLTQAEIKQKLSSSNSTWQTINFAIDNRGLRDQIEKIDLDRRSYTFWHDPDEAAWILAQQTRNLETIARIEHLKTWLDELSDKLEPHASRSNMDQTAASLLRLEFALSRAQRELVAMGDDGYWDTLVEITPIGGRRDARDFLFNLYASWAKERRLQVVMLHEPMESGDAVAFAIKGQFAHGYLKPESGHHRVRHKRESIVARVRVTALSERGAKIKLSEQRALKEIGQLAGRIRSRVAILGTNLVLQNDRTIAENRELALDVGPSWTQPQMPTSTVVRRYDLDPFVVRDHLTKTDYNRREILSPKLFHNLLCARIDKLFSSI
jgi:ATP-dependent Clp protease ATP-binding subunit ClpC